MEALDALAVVGKAKRFAAVSPDSPELFLVRLLLLLVRRRRRCRHVWPRGKERDMPAIRRPSRRSLALVTVRDSPGVAFRHVRHPEPRDPPAFVEIRLANGEHDPLPIRAKARTVGNLQFEQRSGSDPVFGF